MNSICSMKMMQNIKFRKCTPFSWWYIDGFDLQPVNYCLIIVLKNLDWIQKGIVGHFVNREDLPIFFLILCYRVTCAEDIELVSNILSSAKERCAYWHLLDGHKIPPDSCFTKFFSFFLKKGWGTLSCCNAI